MSTAGAMIQLQEISKRFGSFTAVEKVNLDVQPGEFLTLLGPSGCGKTTLLRMLSGFETPSTGQIIIGGKDVTQLPPYRRNVNQVFQSYALFPHLNVEQNIAFGLKMQNVKEEEVVRRVREAIALVALQGFEKRRPSELSGGQRQRVALARAIVPNPEVLLLDEPLSALDAKLRKAMQIELKRLQRQLGLTTVFVTHDQEEALTLSDRVAVMRSGRIEQLGTPSEIYHHPATAFVADFIGEANLLEVQVFNRSGRTLVRTVGGFELFVRTQESVGNASDACLATIRPEKIHVSAEPLQGENVFFARIDEEVFQGATDRLVLSLAGGGKLSALVTNESSRVQPLHVGDQVHCAIHPEDVVLVKRSAI